MPVLPKISEYIIPSTDNCDFSLFMALLIKSKFGSHIFPCRTFFGYRTSGVAINILQTQVLMSSDAPGVTAAYVRVPSFTVLTEQLGLPTFVTELAASITGGFNITWKSGVRWCYYSPSKPHFAKLYQAADIEGASQWEKLFGK